MNQHIEKPEYACLRPVAGSAQQQVKASSRRQHYFLLSKYFIQFQEIVYEEINPKGLECGPDAVKLHTLLHSGSFYEVYSGTVGKLKGCTQGTEVVVKRNKGNLAQGMV